MNGPCLEVIDLSFTPVGKEKPAIAQLNLTIAPGEAVLIAGETGSGKSTLLNCLAGIIPEYQAGKMTGQIQYQGQDCRQWSLRQRAEHLGLLRQNVETQLFTDRVWDEVVFGLENWAVPAKDIPVRVSAILQEFSLIEQQHWPISRLSAGQKQRLALGCLLAIQQPILLLDEPFAYLDHAGVNQLLKQLQYRKAQGQTIVLVEHRLTLAEALCDLRYDLDAGRLKPEPAPPNARSIRPSIPPSPSAPSVPQAKAPILYTQNLSWGGYPPFPDLTIAPGEAVFLQGHNGCGKTTLMRLISGLLKPTTGQIELLGQVTTRHSPVRIAKAVGFVLQNPNHQLFADTVQAEVQKPGVDGAIAEQLLNQLKLADYRQQHPQALSQGQKRRLALGAVLARNPKLCLLDEIMVGQDRHSLELMIVTLQTFLKAGGSLLFTAHDPMVTALLSARTVSINRPMAKIETTAFDPWQRSENLT